MPLFSRKQVNAVVLGCFGLLRCGFGCGNGQCFFVSIVLTLCLRFSLVVTVSSCLLLFLLTFVVFCCFTYFYFLLFDFAVVYFLPFANFLCFLFVLECLFYCG